MEIVIVLLACRVMANRNPRRERTADRQSSEISRPLRNDNDRGTPTPPPINRYDINTLPSIPHERHFERLRKLGATPFCDTLDPAEAEAWLESTDMVFNLMQCTPGEKFDYAVLLLQGDT